MNDLERNGTPANDSHPEHEPPQGWHGSVVDTEYAERQAELDRAVQEAERYGVDAQTDGNQPDTVSPRKAPRRSIAQPYKFHALKSSELAAADFRLEFAIKRTFVIGQPCVAGGPSKGMKTTSLIDMGLSLSSATSFLGEFPVYRKWRVLLVSGESGEAVIQETARRISAAKGIDLAAANMLWSFKLPAIGVAEHLQELVDGIKREGVQIVILDPLYLSLLAGGVDANAGNVFEIGPLLANFAQACLEVDCTPIIAHHFKQSIPVGEIPDLGHLSFTGCQQYARQWLLWNRAKPYSHDGKHELYMVAGGSAGHGGLWHVNIDEGQTGETFGNGRRWDVKVVTGTDARATEAEQRQAAKEQARAATDKADDVQLLNAIDELDPHKNWVSYTKARDHARLRNDKADRSVTRLVREETIEEGPIEVTIGSGAKRTVRGIRRRPSVPSGHHQDTNSGTDGMDHQYHTPLLERGVCIDGPDGTKRNGKRKRKSVPKVKA